MKIIECPRDAIQGIKKFIPTSEKIELINTLLKVGYDTIDFGSFVSHTAIPQLKDTEDVLEAIDLSNTNTKLLVIVGNTYGCEIASKYEKITYIGFPFSISPTFLQKNINSTISKTIVTLNKLLNICTKDKKTLVVYMSMGFGNPYEDAWSIELVEEWIDILNKLGVKIISISDTIGISTSDDIYSMFSYVIPKYKDIEFGFHLHTNDLLWYDQVDYAYKAGCRRFDSVLDGIGGCPLSGYEMTGNLKTRNLVKYLRDNEVEIGIDQILLEEAYKKAVSVYSNIE